MGKPLSARATGVCKLCQVPRRSPPAQPSPAGGGIVAVLCAAFLCLGLCLGQETYLQTETLPKPTIWAEPSSPVAQGRPVSIWCQGSKNADRYYLHQEWAPQPWRKKSLQRPRDKVKFHILLMTQDLARRYHCMYQSQASWSVPSEPLDLVVTGMFDPPSLSTLSSPIVTSGDGVTLHCGSWQRFDWFFLSSEGGNGHFKSLTSQRRVDGWSWVLFAVGPVSPSHRWMYSCYGAFSDSPYVWSSSSNFLELLISGVSRKPSLSILPGPVVAPGDTVTLQCRSDFGYDRFALSKDGGQELPQQLGRKPQAGLSQTDFPLGHVSGAHGGRYRCYGGHNLSSEWSAPSDSLDILVAALLPQNTSLTLSAQPSPTMAPGENVTLRCQTGSLFDAFLLLKEGVTSPPLRLRARSRDGVFQANFPMSPATLDHGGTYRCYGSLSTAPFLLSHPSNPLELKVEGAPVTITPSVQTPNATSGTQHPDYTVENLIRIGLSALILVVLGVLVYQEWPSRRGS